MARYRSVCFTLNNYTEVEVTTLKSNVRDIRYCVFQQERGANGTPHLQGFAYCDNKKTLAQWKRLLGERCHIEQTMGTPAQADAYCRKEDTREPGTEPWSIGSLPQQGARTDLSTVAAAVRSGATDEEIAESHPGDFIRYHSGIRFLRQIYAKPRTFKTFVHWWYGATGTGKSAEAFERFPDAYWKMGTNKWWDGYIDQAEVIVDDYRRDLCTFAELLRLFDRYPYRVEFKGGSTQFVARHLVITTPLHPRDTWAGRTEEDLGQLMRRIDEIRLFGDEPVLPNMLIETQP